MENTIFELFSYSFLTRAFVVGVLVSLCASLLGVCLVLKRYSMIGDGLSHVGFGALSIASVLNLTPLAFSVPVVIITAVCLLKMSENGKLKGDSVIALISSSALAIGVFAVSINSGVNVDINNYMFGSILSLSNADTVVSVVLSVVVILLFVIFYNRIFSVTFDEAFSKATGTKTSVYNMLIAILTSLTVVLGMRMMGALLISCLIIFPAITSMCVCKNFKSVVICSSFVSVICFVIGMFLSIALGTPVGASIVIINLVALIMFKIISMLIRGRVL